MLMAGATLLYVQQVPPVYEAEATLQVSPSTPDGSNRPQDAVQLVQTYVEAIRVRPVLEAAAAQAGVTISPGELAKRVSARTVRDTELLRILVDDSDPQTAARLANAVADVFIAKNREAKASQFASSRDNLSRLVDSLRSDLDARTKQLETLKAEPESQARDTDIARLQAEVVQLQNTYGATVRSYEELRVAEARGASTLIVLESAESPAVPIYPRPFQTVLVGGVVGLALAILLAVVAQRVDDRLREPSQVATEMRVTCLGTIPRIHDGSQSAPEQLRQHLADSYRLVRSSLLAALMDQSRRTLLVTSPEMGDGKSTVAASLAMALAESGEQVVLVDADLHHPRQSTLFELPGQVGLSTLLVDLNRPLSQALYPADVPNLWILPAGPPSADPSGLLASRAFEHRLRELHRVCDVVLIDTPPVLAASDAALLGSRADGVILVLDATKSRGRRSKQALETLIASGATVVGTVLNKCAIDSTEYSAYATYHQFAQTPGADTQDEPYELVPVREALS